MDTDCEQWAADTILPTAMIEPPQICLPLEYCNEIWYGKSKIETSLPPMMYGDSPKEAIGLWTGCKSLASAEIQVIK